MKKKILVILITLIGFGLSASAQICTRADGVQPSFKSYATGGGVMYQGVSFYNSNNTKVTVNVTVTIVLKDGSEEVFERTFVIKPNSDRLDDGRSSEALLKTGIDNMSVNLPKSKAEVLDCTKW